MIVADVWKNISDTLGTCNEEYLYAILSEAIELGSNKGLYDPLIGYLRTTVGADNYVYLPRDVDSIIRINIDGNPSFSRDRLFEFSLNTDGTATGDTVGFTWDDRVTSPLQRTLDAPRTFAAVAVNSADNGKKITIYGLDASNREIEEELTISDVETQGSVSFSEVTRVVKDETEYPVSLVGDDALEYAFFYPEDVDPFYRRIRVSKADSVLRIMYRKATFKVSRQSDFIPLHHRMAVVMFCKAAKHYRDDNFDLAMACETQGHKMLEERQAALSSALTAAQHDKVTATNQNIGVIEGVVVADIYDEACEIVGAAGRKKVYDAISEAVKLLRDQALWDADLGFVDIAVQNTGKVTIPRYADVILSVASCCGPLVMQNKWHQFHIGGSGMGGNCMAWQRLPDVVTVNQIDEPTTLEAWASDLTDNGKKVTVYGTDENGITRVEELSVHNLTPVPGVIKFASITRIQKEESEGFITLYQTGSDGKMMGHYYPDELEPNYAQIKVGMKSGCVSIAYRKRQFKISSMQDFINTKSRQAILLAMRGIEAMKQDVQSGSAFIEQAISILSAEQANRNAGDMPTMQIDPYVSPGIGNQSIEFC